MQDLQQYYKYVNSEIDRKSKGQFGSTDDDIYKSMRSSGYSREEAYEAAYGGYVDKQDKQNFARRTAQNLGLDLTEGQIDLATGRKIGFLESVPDGLAEGVADSIDAIPNLVRLATGKKLRHPTKERYERFRQGVRGFTNDDVEQAGAKTWGGHAGSFLGYSVPIIASTLATEGAVGAGLAAAKIPQGLRAAQAVGGLAKAEAAMAGLVPKATLGSKAVNLMTGTGMASRAARMGAIGSVETLPLDITMSTNRREFDMESEVDPSLLVQNIALNVGLSAASPAIGAGLMYAGKSTKRALQGAFDNKLLKKATLGKDLEAAKADGRKSRAEVFEQQKQQEAAQQAVEQQKVQTEISDNQRMVSEYYPSEIGKVESENYGVGRKQINKDIIASREALVNTGKLDPDSLNLVTEDVYTNSHKNISPTEIEKYGQYKVASDKVNTADKAIAGIQDQLAKGEGDISLLSEQLKQFNVLRNIHKQDLLELEPYRQSVETKLDQLQRQAIEKPALIRKASEQDLRRAAQQADFDKASTGQQAIDFGGQDLSIKPQPRLEQGSLDLEFPAGKQPEQLPFDFQTAAERSMVPDDSIPGQGNLFKQPETPVATQAETPFVQSTETAPRAGLDPQFAKDPVYGTEERGKLVAERRAVQKQGATELPAKDVPIQELAARSQGTQKKYPIVALKKGGSFVMIDYKGKPRKYGNTPESKAFKEAVKKEDMFIKAMKKSGKEAQEQIEREIDSLTPSKKNLKRTKRCK